MATPVLEAALASERFVFYGAPAALSSVSSLLALGQVITNRRAAGELRGPTVALVPLGEPQTRGLALTATW